MDGIERGLVETARRVLPGGSLGNMDGDAIIREEPCAEQVRFTSSGTEADAYAMRLPPPGRLAGA